MTMEPDRAGRLPEGTTFTNMFNCSEFLRPQLSADLSPRLANPLKIPVNMPPTASVTHRPWEDSVPCDPPWSPAQHLEGPVNRFPGKPKTFKPVLLYHRPEDSHLPCPPRFRPCCGHVPFHACEDDSGGFCLSPCHEDVENSLRELYHSAVVQEHLYRMGQGVCESGHGDCLDCNYCSCGFPAFLGHRTHPMSSMEQSAINGCLLHRPERVADLFRRHCHAPYPVSNDPYPYTFSEAPAGFPTFLAHSGGPPFQHRHKAHGHSIPHGALDHATIHRTPYHMSDIAGHPPLASFPMPPHNRYSAIQPTPKRYFSVFPRHPETKDRESASEIRRALLTNHSVHYDNANRSGSSTKAADFHDKRSKHVDARSAGFIDNHGRVHTEDMKSSEHTGQNCGQMRVPPSSPLFSMSPADGQCLPAASAAGMTPQAPTRPASSLSLTTQVSPVSSITTDGSEGWQEWYGRYGSFVQFLNSPDSLCPVDTCSSLTSCVPDPASKQFTSNRPASCAQEGFVDRAAEQTTKSIGHTSAEEGATDVADDKDNKKHKCPYCDVTCTNNGQLKGHLRVHTGERPYKCECGRAFARNEELTRHRRIHSGLRPHVCTLCAKRFGRKDHLNKHVKTHLRTSEKKTHACHVPGCQQRYTRSDALARHQWGAHGIKPRTSRIRPILSPATDDPQPPTPLGHTWSLGGQGTSSVAAFS